MSAPDKAFPLERLLTVEDHVRWETEYARPLWLAVANRDSALDDAENARFARAQHEILTALRPLRKRGFSLDEAAAELIHRWCESRPYSYTDLINTLRALNYKHGAKRREPQPWERRHG